MSDPYGHLVIGTLPPSGEPIQACLFCSVRWGWVVKPNVGLAHWGVLHKNTCEGNAR
jgi:hypothetical protein